jgi:hypothetical protein
MKKAFMLSALLLAGTLWAGTYNGGLGTQSSPYRISTGGNWQELMNTPLDWSSHFVLTQNIFFIMGSDLAPVGSVSQPFTGVMDGQGHYLTGASINLPDESHVGLFGYIGSGGQVKNLGSRISVSGQGDVGGVAGENLGTLTDCYVTASVTGTTDWAGGLVGLNRGTVTRCYADGPVSGLFDVGGLAGGNSGTLTDCYATGSVSGTTVVGGLVGYHTFGTIQACYATGSVSGTGNHFGGLVGYQYDSDISLSYAAGPVSGIGHYHGGLVGYIDYNSTVIYCYAAGPVSGGWHVGGLAGWNDNMITACYAAGPVSGTAYFGGLAGTNTHNILACFWDTQTSGLTDGVGSQDPDPSGVMGKTSVQMKTISTFTAQEWDFIDVWGMVENQTYPYLRIYRIADLNCDGFVNLADLEIFASQWLMP